MSRSALCRFVAVKTPVSLPGAVVNLSLEDCAASCGQGDILMFSSRDAYDNDFCPVRDELLGEMYRANANGLAQLVESVSSDVRAMLALFCYRRSHLHSLALSIAASCSERELIQVGGRVGSTLYALSREAPAARSGASSSYGGRKPRRRNHRATRCASSPANAGGNHRPGLSQKISAAIITAMEHGVWIPVFAGTTC